MNVPSNAQVNSALGLNFGATVFEPIQQRSFAPAPLSQFGVPTSPPVNISAGAQFGLAGGFASSMNPIGLMPQGIAGPFSGSLQNMSRQPGNMSALGMQGMPAPGQGQQGSATLLGMNVNNSQTTVPPGALVNRSSGPMAPMGQMSQFAQMGIGPSQTGMPCCPA